ncbi:DUF2306 domain-containing protein [Pseudovibrio sp. SPO723]|uniref:DUF2306 domain-containing protein n=1 Tax=Nesiotobacter zosterae TaxID=392721 RepID=UPI0029C237D6|nr:DUF2306 domain-containing protein [Pseudovibrio sp. SPO723]MDX5594229.1 DUF2306 domain-containing protein [Pseudovibrio sp. SPO723]
MQDASFGRLLDADLALQVHVGAAVAAVIFLPAILGRRKGDTLHKLLGYSWALAMTVLAVSSFWLQGLQIVGPFSPIHLLSIYTLIQLTRALFQARRRQIDRHGSTMRQLAAYALGGAGVLAFLPDRLMNEMIFGGSWLGFIGVGVITLAVILYAARRQKAMA